MQEITALRDYNAKHFDNGDGTFTGEFHGGHIHYKDANGDFQDSDFTLEDQGAYWRMAKHNYRLFVAKNFGAAQLIRFDNRFNGRNHTIYYEPNSLRWVNNPDLSDMSLWRSAQTVVGAIVNPGHKLGRILYQDAFGSGVDFEIVLTRKGIYKFIRINSLASLENPPTGNHRLAGFFKYEGAGLKLISRTTGAVDWNEDDYYEGLDGFHLGEIAKRQNFSLIRPAFVRDSSNPPELLKLKVFWKKHNGFLWQAKILPNKQWFQAATFPVRADTTTDYYSTVGDGELQQDDNSSSFAAVHDGAGEDTQTLQMRVDVWRIN